MSKSKYKKIQKINLSVTKRLLEYINEEMKKENVLEELSLFDQDFFSHNIAFDLWLSFDFLDEDNHSFIESFLIKYSESLKPDEIKILQSRNDSNISLFEIISINEGFILIKNILENKEELIWEEDLAKGLNIGDLIFSRVANLIGLNTFVGSISYLPPSVKDKFIREIFIDFNTLREAFPDLDMKEYLKNHSVNLYTIYTSCVFEAIELEYDISSVFYDEIEEFQSYLTLKEKHINSDKIISSLIEFFEYYLADDDLSLHDIDQIDFKSFFHAAINDGFIMSNEVLNSYIQAFKTYLAFLSNVDKKYKESYKSILSISNSRFHFMNLLKDTKTPFKINENFCNIIKDDFNDFYSIPLIDFDKFLLYMINNPVDLTDKNKKIKRVHLIEINDILDLSEEVKKKAPNQIDFPVIELYYNISIFLGLCEIKASKLYITSKGSSFLRLRDEEKFTIFFEYIWSKDFVDTIYELKSEKSFKKHKKDLLEFFSSLEENKKHEMIEVFPKTSIDSEFFFHYYQYLKFIGMIDYNLYPNYEISITPLGKTIVDYLLSKKTPSPNGKLIQLNSRRKDNSN